MEQHAVESAALDTFADLLTASARQVRDIRAKDLARHEATARRELLDLLQSIDAAVAHVRHLFALPHHIDTVGPTDMSEQTPFPL